MADLAFVSLDHLPTRTGLGLMLHSIWSSRLQSSYNLCTASDQMFPLTMWTWTRLKLQLKCDVLFSPQQKNPDTWPLNGPRGQVAETGSVKAGCTIVPYYLQGWLTQSWLFHTSLHGMYMYTLTRYMCSSAYLYLSIFLVYLYMYLYVNFSHLMISSIECVWIVDTGRPTLISWRLMSVLPPVLPH